jgi:ribosomal protein L34E
METMVIEDKDVQTKRFVEYARTPSATVIGIEKKKSFEEACAECNAITVDVFIDELNASIKEYFENHA